MHELETERLMLRPFLPEDDETILRISSDPDTVKYLYFWGREGKTPRQDADRFLYEHAIREWEREPIRMREYAVVLKETGKVIGDASIEDFGGGTGEIGWILLPEYRGNGYIHEAGERLLEFAFDTLGLFDVTACCDIRNVPSRHVMERLGMHLKERVPNARPDKGDGIQADELVYMVNRADWWWRKNGGSSYVKRSREKLGHDVLTFVGASVFLYRDGKLLLEKRADDGKWCTCGGCNEPGEPLEETARREVKEETGLNVRSLTMIGIYSQRNSFHTYPNGDMAWIVDTAWLCEDFDGELIPQEEEVTQLKWFPVNALPPKEEWEGDLFCQAEDFLKLLEARKD